MKLFSASLMTWDEPILFVVRLRKARGWIWRAAAALVITAVLFGAIWLQPLQRMGVIEMVLLSLAAGGFLVLIPDFANFQRSVSINEDGISYIGVAGWTITMGTFGLSDIKRVQLLRPDEWDKPYGVMWLHLADDQGFLLGVPNKVPLETIASVLFRLDLDVELHGWEPTAEDTRVQITEEVALPRTEETSRDARIWHVDEQDGRLNPPSSQVIAGIIALAPLAISLVSMVIAGIYLYLQWGMLVWLGRGLILGVAGGAVVLSFAYLALAGQFLASRYLIGVAQGVLRTRPNARVRADEPDLRPVEIFDRTAWTSMIAKSIDFGFLHIDESQRVIRFEGDKQRWDIPFAALQACRIEEAQVGKEGTQDADKRYFVVIAIERDESPWEAGMIQTRTQLGNDGNQQKHERAQALLRRFSAAIAKGQAAVST